MIVLERSIFIPKATHLERQKILDTAYHLLELNYSFRFELMRKKICSKSLKKTDSDGTLHNNHSLE